MHPNEKLSGYLDGELDAVDRSAVEEHLASCAECRALLERMRAIQAAAQASDVGEANIDAAEVDRFIAENRSRRAQSSPQTAQPARGEPVEPRAGEVQPFVLRQAQDERFHSATGSKPRTSRPAPERPSRSFGLLSFGLATAAGAILVIATFVALGGPLRNMFANAVGTETMGQNQAALSAGIY